MSKYTGPKCRLCRAEGKQLFLKGDRCFSKDKCAVHRRGTPPGMHGTKRRGKVTGYGEQLREKQKIKKMYGVLEKQFRIYVEHATSTKGVSGVNLLQQLERRLDNIVTRANFAPSRASARTLINHGHFTVNGRKVNIPSYLVKVNDVVEVAEKSRGILSIKTSVENAAKRPSVDWLQVEADKFRVSVKRMPERTDIDPQINENIVIEFYSR